MAKRTTRLPDPVIEDDPAERAALAAALGAAMDNLAMAYGVAGRMGDIGYQQQLQDMIRQIKLMQRWT